MDTTILIQQIIDLVMNNFDFVYCLIVNLLTFTVIKIIDEINKDKEVSTLVKRIVLIICILSTGVVYWLIGANLKPLINSAILAPLAWSWVFKPICKKLGIDYKEVDRTIPK